MTQIKKVYIQPGLTVMDIDVENQLLVASNLLTTTYEEKIYDEEGSGTDALSKRHSATDFWDDNE